MEEMVLRTVSIVERHNHCRVTKAVFEFVQDEQAKIWLVCSTECAVVFNTAGPLKPMSVPMELKRARATRTADFQRLVQDEREQRTELEQQLVLARQTQVRGWPASKPLHGLSYRPFNRHPYARMCPSSSRISSTGGPAQRQLP